MRSSFARERKESAFSDDAKVVMRVRRAGRREEDEDDGLREKRWRQGNRYLHTVKNIN